MRPTPEQYRGLSVTEKARAKVMALSDVLIMEDPEHFQRHLGLEPPSGAELKDSMALIAIDQQERQERALGDLPGYNRGSCTVE